MAPGWSGPKGPEGCRSPSTAKRKSFGSSDELQADNQKLGDRLDGVDEAPNEPEVRPVAATNGTAVIHR
jgi:hypothetical protein